MKKNSYIGISLIVLVFGIYAVPKIVDRLKNDNTVDQPKDLKSNAKLAFLEINDTLKQMPDFTFRNQDSLLISKSDFKGKVYVVDFFFTSCPTICPVMTENMKILEKAYGNRDDFAIASFTISPQIDTPIVLKKYAERHGVTSLNWHFLTEEDQNVYDLSNKGLNIFTGINPAVEGGFEHQGFFALIDKNGYIRSRKDQYGNPIVYYQGTDKEQVEWIKEDIQKLLEE
ncbi:SCO family protein [Flavobacteriaceae bacterium F08102]|nr:SCO family protein [Flavobacteriaceae bacterium F08102]